jgi:hypothetical protein
MAGITDEGGTLGLTPEAIERFRQIGLRIDRSGRVLHQGVEVTHPGLRRAILRWLDVLDDGRSIVRLDALRYAYIDVEDTHLRAVSLRWEGDVPWIRLDDGSDEPLDCAGLRLGADLALRTRARGGRLRCRLTTAAQQQLADHLVEIGDHVHLRAAGREWPLG